MIDEDEKVQRSLSCRCRSKQRQLVGSFGITCWGIITNPKVQQSPMIGWLSKKEETSRKYTQKEGQNKYHTNNETTGILFFPWYCDSETVNLSPTLRK